MWFGGIGTYIRASSETDADAGDRANDAIRVTGADLRCKVIGEGANLGATQRGRIEAARAGVRLNTDAIDNSAGVNSSDVEVNIKIALATPMADGRLTLETRNPLLASMTDDVGKLVLRNNYLQSLAVSLTENRGVADVADERRLMQAMEAEGRLDRKVEYLPDDLGLEQLERQGRGLTRPELSVLLAYAKLAFHDAVLASDVPDDPYFAVELRRYFPDGVRVGYPDAVDSHRLRREIIATGLANAVINRTGPSLAQRLADDTGRPLSDVARAYALTRDAFGVLDVNTAIDALDAKVSGKLQMDLYAAVQTFTIDRMMWFMRHVDFSAGLSSLVGRFTAGEGLGSGAAETQLWQAQGVPATMAAHMGRLSALAGAPDAILVSERAGTKPVAAVRALAGVSAELRAGDIKAAAHQVVASDSYERLALARTADGVDAALRALAAEAIAAGGTAAWQARRQGGIKRTRRTVDEMLTGQPSLAKLTMAAAALAELSRE
jgi:glutamate dehydrogenase